MSKSVDDKPNVLVFISDALRADHLSCYGYERDTTPNIDMFAARHTRYENAFTPSTWTRSVAPSLLTGTYPSIHGVNTLDDFFTSDLPRWPEVLRENGYRTVGISAIGNVSSGIGFDRGFDRFIDLYKDESLTSHRAESTASDELLEHESGRVTFPTSRQVIDRFETKVLEQDGEEPFFTFLWTIDPHDPYQPPDGFEEYVDAEYDGPIDGTRESLRRASSENDFQRLIDLYDSEIRHTDHAFRNLLNRLEQHGVFDNTMVIFAGDHGEAFGDHEGNVGHSHVPYEELMRIPIIIRYPDDQPKWDGDDELVSLIDLMPTTLDYLGIDNPLEMADDISGRSVLERGRSAIYSETDYADVQNSFYAVRQQRLKYIKTESPNRGIQPYLQKLVDPEFMIQVLTNPVYFLRRRFGVTSERLYDIQRDPKETENLVESNDHVDELREQLAEWRTKLEDIEFTSETRDEQDGLDEQTEEQLREMGYIE
ncbi:sulfatase [Halococcus sp. AFM35]|uniref:sulfatase n=1 Tax=Halococcus sp. AFM35 TaxID=3421653 RepID=UPI003EC0DCDA